MRAVFRLAVLVLFTGCFAARPAPDTAGNETAANTAARALQSAAREPGAVVTESGSVVRIIENGSGPQPRTSQTVTLRYRTSLLGGQVIDSTESRPVPPTVLLANLSPCLAETVQRMSVGAKGRATCRDTLVYAGKPMRGVAPGSALVVDLELVDIGRPLPPAGH